MARPTLRETACVIADVQMRKLSGLDLQNRLRAEGYDTPIIFITAFPEERIKTAALKGGAVCFLSKPFDGQVMIDCLTDGLGREGQVTGQNWG